VNRKFAVGAAIVIVILAAGLRIWGIGWGLPTSLHYFSYHPDETITLFGAMRVNFFEGRLDPGFYNYGSLYMYLVNIAVLLASCWGLINLPSGDIFSAIGEFAKVYMAGRAVAVLLGIATVYLVYLLGKRAYGRGTGLLAALFVAVMPIHVMHSKFLAVDVPATFFAALALIFAVRITQGCRLRDYLLSGLFAGLAAGTKYNAGLVILAPIAAHLATGKARPALRAVSPKLLAILLPAIVGFLIGTPGALLNRDMFIHDFLHEAVHVKAGHGLIFTGTPCGYVYHATHSLPAGMGLPLLALALIGLLYAVWKRTPGDLALLAFVIAYYAVIGAAQVKFARYTIPMLPVLAVLAARVSADLVGRLRAGGSLAGMAGYLVALVVALVAGYTAVYSIAIDAVFARTDTRDLAAVWVKTRVPKGSSIALPTIPWFYTPPLDPYFGLPEPAERYERVNEFTDYVLVVSESEWNADFLRRESPDYVILSEFEYSDRLRIHDAAAREYFRALRRDYSLKREFRNPLARKPWILLVDTLPHDMSYAGPTILIYSRRAR